MRKLIAVAAGLVMAATACAGGEAPRTILVDYSHDEFASFVAANFPRELSVRPGAELVFKQTWTGEPHSVTGGTLVNELMQLVEPYIEKGLRGEEIPEEPPKAIEKLEDKVPWSYYEDEEATDFNQSGAQPCYLEDRNPPTKGEPCAKRDQEQPEFTGTQRYYNSGLIRYEGPQGNEYRVKLADDIEPGDYWFYCNVHGEFQSTKVVVKSATAKVDTEAAVNRRARDEIETAFEPLLKVYQRGAEERELQLEPKDEDSTVKGDFAGIFDPQTFLWHSINEFIPRRMSVKAGEEITWNLFGFHTISFGVPKYFPVLTFEEDGSVRRNPKLDPPAGGADAYEGPEGDFDPDAAKGPIEFDGGTYDGNGFWSSGAIGGDPWIEYSMRITKPGTYRYACLVHPPMVGTVVVT
jgi:plastocyanin